MLERHAAAVLATFCALIVAACQPETTDRVTMEGYVEEATEPEAFQPLPEAETGELVQVHAILTEWTVALLPDTVPAGPVQFSIINQGEAWHALAIDVEDAALTTEPMRPGSGSTLVVELQPGSYRVYCPVEDARGEHVDLGMETVLTVR